MRLRLRHHSVLLNLLRLLWVCVIVWLEIGVFNWSLRGCRWPDPLWAQNHANAGQIKPQPAHLLIIADTQVLDDHSLPSVTPYLRRIKKYMIDTNLRKSWNAVQKLRPDGILFLGDMINGGRYARDPAEYNSFAQRFHQLFGTDSDKNVPIYYVVGNHDVGLGRSASFSLRARSRFRASFNNSEPNSIVRFGNHTLVLLDSPGLVEEDYRRAGEDKLYPTHDNLEKIAREKVNPKKAGQKLWRALNNGTVDFIQRFGKEREERTQSGQEPPLPVILFSHIPLARPELAYCGSNREGTSTAGHILRGAGPGYQNLLGKATSAYLLETLQPDAIFSADDHDYCEITHSFTVPSSSTSNSTTPRTSSERKVKEITVKAFSTVPSIRRPGLQLLSLWNPLSSDLSDPTGVTGVSYLGPPSGHTQAERLCLLPDQAGIYTYGYIPLVIVSLGLIFWVNLKDDSSSSSHKRSRSEMVTREEGKQIVEPSYVDSSMLRYEESIDPLPRSPRSTAMIAMGGGSTLLPRQPKVLSIHLQPSPSPHSPSSPEMVSAPASPGFSGIKNEMYASEGSYILLSPSALPSASGDWHRNGDEDNQGRTPMTPGTAGSTWTVADTPRSPVFERSGSNALWNSGGSHESGWRRGGIALSGYGFNIGRYTEMDREKEKRLEKGDRATSPSSRGLRPKWWAVSNPQNGRKGLGIRAILDIIRHTFRKIHRLLLTSFWMSLLTISTMRDLVMGRPITGRASMWKRLLWDAILVFVPATLIFCIINWWIMP